MNDQILDDFDEAKSIDNEIEMPIWKYRIVGVFRMFISLVIIFMIARMTDIFQYLFSSEEVEKDLIIPAIIAIIVIILFIFPIIYHVNQGWAELRLKLGFSKKRRFRSAGIIANIFFIGAFSIRIIFIGFEFLYSEETLFVKIPTLIGILMGLAMILGVLITVLMMDKKYRLATGVLNKFLINNSN